MARACSGYNHGQSLIVHIQNNLLLVGWWFSICSIQGWGCNEAWSYWNWLAVSRGLKDVVNLLNIAIFEESMLNHIKFCMVVSIIDSKWTWMNMVHVWKKTHIFTRFSNHQLPKNCLFTFHRAKAELTLWAVKLRGQVTLVYPPIIIIDDLYSYGPKYQSS